jgi:tRNA(Arg) A34 adenosine deaminase TadA
MSDLTGLMHIAIQEAESSLREGNSGFGAVVARGADVLARAHDTEKTDRDPTAHAEIVAIRTAAARAGPDLRGCTLVSTHEPCPMCSTAAAWAGIDEVAYGFSIRDAIREGRRRIDLPCREVFERAGMRVTVDEGILRERCAVLYDTEVRRQIHALRGADEAALSEMARALAERRLRWLDHHPDAAGKESEALLSRAYRLLTGKLGVSEGEAPIVSQDRGSLTFASRNSCPTLEACRILGLDTRQVCRALTEAPTQALLQRLDHRLRFTRDYATLRPFGDACMETISIHDDGIPEERPATGPGVTG